MRYWEGGREGTRCKKISKKRTDETERKGRCQKSRGMQPVCSQLSEVNTEMRCVMKWEWRNERVENCVLYTKVEMHSDYSGHGRAIKGIEHRDLEALVII